MKHYQAVAIIRHKIKSPADAVVASFNTVVNISAIIARLDFTYADKRQIYIVEQELSTLRQGTQTVVQVYDEVRRKLLLLTNKTLMTHDKPLALIINDKCRQDALPVFISGLKKPCDIIFIDINKLDIPFPIKTQFQKMIKSRIIAFADPNEALPYNTNIVATIKMEDEGPVYSKLYPYPMGVADFVYAEIKQLLADGIIRPSRSPYNSPVWVVHKKGVDHLGNKKKRLVIDFRKLNK